MSKSAWAKKPYIIAEIAQGYEGEAKLVDLFVKAAARAEADAVKFQIFFADELALSDYQHYDLFKKLELPFSVWARAIDEAHKAGLRFFSDVFGTDSLMELERIGADGYKVHATDINNISLLHQIAKTEKSVLISIGGCTVDEVARALEILSGCDTALLHGFQAEPTLPSENNLRRLQTIIEKFDVPVGFQDHTAGDSELAFLVPLVALGAGADIVEKHLTLDRTMELEDFVSALATEEFSDWARLARACYKTLGDSRWKLKKGEIEYRQKIKRAVCVKREIMPGEKIVEEDLILRRTGREAVYDTTDIIGRLAKNKIQTRTPITKEDIL